MRDPGWHGPSEAIMSTTSSSVGGKKTGPPEVAPLKANGRPLRVNDAKTGLPVITPEWSVFVASGGNRAWILLTPASGGKWPLLLSEAWCGLVIF